MEVHSEAFVGSSKRLREVVEKIPRLGACDATVLISGETGSGKDLLARAIHYQGVRKSKPFVPVNCAALPDHLVENELFGHVRGAFTGAELGHKGLLEEADEGTLFLDEVNSLNLVAQGKLLRLLQDKEYRPLGSSRNRVANVRIIAATNGDLKSLIQAKQFREDLFHRLNVLSVRIPPLKERREDIPLLAQHFLALYGSQHGRVDLRLSKSAISKLLDYEWPGNVRELESIIQRAVICAHSTLIGVDDIELQVAAVPGSEAVPPEVVDICEGKGSWHEEKVKWVSEFERHHLIRLMTTYQGNVSQAARKAGKERRAFQRLLKKHGLDRTAFMQSARWS